MLLSDNDLKTLLNFAWLTENPRVASSILAPAIVNQRLTTFWVVTIRTTFVLHGGETGVRLPSVVRKVKSM